MLKIFSFLKKVKPADQGEKIVPVVLLVIDGLGIAPPSEGNAISLAKTPTLDKLYATYPHTELIASGEPVGLPATEVGNSEVGHLTLGAGRVIYQYLKRINAAIENSSFFGNKAFLQAAAHVKQHGSKLHLMGLVSSGKVHSSADHLYALLGFCKKHGLNRVYLHLFTDGRDAPPREAEEVVAKIGEYLKTNKIGQIATISGRYYAMDRDRRWERTQKAYQALVLGRGVTAADATSAVKNAYGKGQSDEFIEPTVITPVTTIDDDDAVIFFNFRADRALQLTMAYVLPNFEKLRKFEFGYVPETDKLEGEVKFKSTFRREKIPRNLFFVTMTQYHKDLPVSSVAFGLKIAKQTLAEVISSHQLAQAHFAETEKERMVTYYFDGLREEPFKGEDVYIVASPKVPTYDRKPEMSLSSLVSEFKKQLKKGIYHFMIINFANPDMVAHSGSLKATVVAIEAVDKAISIVVEEVLARGGSVVLTADHGNAEELLSFPTKTFFYTTGKGTVDTDHSNNPVPVIFISHAYQSHPKKLAGGVLSDVAPTILAMMGLPKPEVMTGRNLLS